MLIALLVFALATTLLSLALPRIQCCYRVLSRGGTRPCERRQNAALDLDACPDLVVITSFGKFHENSLIEPSEACGDTLLRSTSSFEEALRIPRRES